LIFERKSLPGAVFRRGELFRQKGNLRLSLKNINHQEEQTMDTNHRPGAARISRAVVFLMLIFVGPFLSNPAMSQFKVTNSNNDLLFLVIPDANAGGAQMHGYIVANGLALSGDNDNRGAIWFATPGDLNLALYNNNPSIDGEDAWDGIKWNSVEGFNFRVEELGEKNSYISALFIKSASDEENTWANVGIGTTSPQGALDVSSTKGGVIVPRISTLERDAPTFIAVNGMIIYNTTTNKFNFYENGAWVTKTNE
jgi:hypothetical protein